MALLQPNGRAILVRPGNANADMSGIGAAKRPSFRIDRTKQNRKLLNLLERIEKRKELEAMRRNYK